MKKPELLCPAGALANLKAAVVSGADAVYLGMNNFTARMYAKNFNKDYLIDAIKICKSNKKKLFLTKPFRPSRFAFLWTKYLNPTPWTLPEIITWTDFIYLNILMQIMSKI